MFDAMTNTTGGVTATYCSRTFFLSQLERACMCVFCFAPFFTMEWEARRGAHENDTYSITVSLPRSEFMKKRTKNMAGGGRGSRTHALNTEEKKNVLLNWFYYIGSITGDHSK